MPPALLRLLGGRRTSPFVLRNFRFEFVSVALMAAALACVDVKVLSVLAFKAFEAGPWVVTLITASDAIANITSLFWTRFLHGTDRVRSANMLQFCVIATVLAIAAAPFTGLGVAMLAGLAVLGRVFVTGIINARTDIWRANYPRETRGQVIAKFTTVATFVIALTALLVATSMDLTSVYPSAAAALPPWLGDHAFRPVYVFAAIVACFGARTFARVRWRGRATQIRAERAQNGLDGAHAASPRAMWRVLREDRDYRRFMAAQFVLGAPNLAAEPIFVLALEPFHLNYTQSMALTRIIPIIVPMLVVNMWGRLLDRMHIIRFRSYHSWVFVVANLLMAAAFVMHNEALLYASRVVLGVAFGGGLLAWELGHHDFAKRETAAIYMGVHVTLTGIRGVFAPFLGTLLFLPAAMDWLAPGLRYPGMGAWTFVLLAAVSATGGAMFVKLYRDTRHRTSVKPGSD